MKKKIALIFGITGQDGSYLAELLIKKGCCSIIQPSGSLNDKNVIKYVNKEKVSLYFINNRFFKH